MMKKWMPALLLVAGLLLCMPAQAEMNLLWDVPVEQEGTAYIRALESASGVRLSLQQTYGDESVYASPEDADMTLYDAPVSLLVSLYQRKPQTAVMSVDTGAFARAGSWEAGIGQMLDYQQTLVAALTERFGAPTAGAMLTDMGEGVSWDYPGNEAGVFNRAQMDAVIAAETMADIIIMWDNVALWTGWESFDGERSMHTAVYYVLEEHEALMDARGFTVGARYPGGEDWTAAPAETTPVQPIQGAAQAISLHNDIEKWNVKVEGGGYDVNVSVPQVEGLADQRIQDAVNALLRNAVYAEAGTYEDRRERTVNIDTRYSDYTYTAFGLMDAWTSGDLLAVYGYGSQGGSGTSNSVILYIDLAAGQELAYQPLFRNAKTVEMMIKSFTWEYVKDGSNVTWAVTYQDVMDTEPAWYWVGRDGLVAIYDDETLDRRQVDVLIPWADIAPYMNPSNEMYAAVMAGVQTLAFEQ